MNAVHAKSAAADAAHTTVLRSIRRTGKSSFDKCKSVSRALHQRHVGETVVNARPPAAKR
jgi:hypothetical protein